MTPKRLKFIVLNLASVLTLSLVACTDNKGQVSNSKTAPAQTGAENSEAAPADDKKLSQQLIADYLKQINQSKGTELEEKSWQKSSEALQEAIKENFGGDINDTEPEILIPQKVEPPTQPPAPAPAPVPAPTPRPTPTPTPTQAPSPAPPITLARPTPEVKPDTPTQSTSTPKVDFDASQKPDTTGTETDREPRISEFDSRIGNHIVTLVQQSNERGNFVIPPATAPDTSTQAPKPKGQPQPQPPPIDRPIERPEQQTTDLSPIKLLRNLLCKTPLHCMPALEEPRDQAVGFYYYRKDFGFGGKLINGGQLPVQGNGYYVKTGSQSKRWATDHTIVYIQKLAENAEKLKLTNLLIVGNISQFGGGYVPGQKNGTVVAPGHQSHQNGLDIDIGLIQKPGSNSVKETFPKNFVVNHALTDQFPITENWQFINMAMSSKWNLFVLAHPAIKKKFCEIAKASGEFDKYKRTLSLILPESCHYDHYHFRLKCPASSPRCIPHEPLPENPGCDDIKFLPCQIATNSK